MQRGGRRVGRVREMQEEEFGRGRGQKSGDVRGCKMINAFEIPISLACSNRKFGNRHRRQLGVVGFFLGRGGSEMEYGVGRSRGQEWTHI